MPSKLPESQSQPEFYTSILRDREDIPGIVSHVKCQKTNLSWALLQKDHTDGGWGSLCENEEEAEEGEDILSRKTRPNI